MSDVLLDNFSIGRITDIVKVNQKDFRKNYYLKIYLYALILWDKIYSVPRPSPSSLHSWKYIGCNYVDASSLYADLLGVDTISYKGYYEIENLARKISSEYNKMVLGQEGINAIYYLLLGYNIGMNVLLSDKRARFISKSGISEKMYSRVDVVEKLDKEVAEYYNEINVLLGKNLFSLETPLLVDYICSEAANLNEAISIAMELRKDKHVIKFRKAMDAMERALNSGNKAEFTEYIKLIPQIVNQIKKGTKKTRSAELVISLAPAINIPINWEIPPSNHKMINMNFLFDLAKYGIKGERIFR